MKKLIAIAALAACLPAFSGQVPSTNTVGYQKLALGAGFNMCSPTFMTIGGGSISIQDLKPVGENVGGWGDVQIQIVDGDANISDSYLWFTADNSGLDGDYWCDGNMAPANVTITDGSSVLVFTDNAFSLLCYGEVVFEQTDVAVSSGFNSVGNAKNAALNIQEFIPTGANVGGWGDVQIQIVDEDANISASYLWFTAENSGLAGDYWCDGDMAPADVTFNPGDGFLLFSDNAATLTIPAILQN